MNHDDDDEIHSLPYRTQLRGTDFRVPYPYAAGYLERTVLLQEDSLLVIGERETGNQNQVCV